MGSKNQEKGAAETTATHLSASPLQHPSAEGQGALPPTDRLFLVKNCISSENINSLNASTPGNISTLAEKSAGRYWSPAGTPSGWAARETKCSTASSSCESLSNPSLHHPASAAEGKKTISLPAAAAPTLPATPWQEVTPVAVQARVLLTPSVICGLIPGSNCRGGQTQKAAKPRR